MASWPHSVDVVPGQTDGFAVAEPASRILSTVVTRRGTTDDVNLRLLRAVRFSRRCPMAAKNSSPSQIPRVTFASMVGERIRSNIIEGVLPPGTQLNEVELAGAFGVSRGPVREALQRLIQEGLLRSEPHRGVFVPVMTPEDIDDVYLAREALETAAVRRIARMGRSASAHKMLDQVVQGMRTAADAGDWRTVADRDLDFHTELVSATASPRLARMF